MRSKSEAAVVVRRWKHERWRNPRWWIACLLDRFKDTCWVDLYLWAEYKCNHAFMEIFDIRGSAGQCARRDEYAYCGKCEATGVHSAEKRRSKPRRER